jgi:heterodisulfide reductase subunit A
MNSLGGVCVRGVLIVGGGISGCTAADMLAQSHIPVYIVDKSKNIGGKAINYGCKATDTCLKCNMCLTQDIWQNVNDNRYIDIMTGADVLSCQGDKGDYRVMIRLEDGLEREINVSYIIVAIGFQPYDLKNKGFFGYGLYKNVLDGLDVEQLLKQRTPETLPFINPSIKKLAFLQCVGSRDVQDKAPYCSKVCCAYALRMGQTIHHYYPNIEITYFYMDIQEVGGVFSDYYDRLVGNGFKFVLSRPVMVEEAEDGGLEVIHEDLAKASVVREKFDMVILSQGIRPADDVDYIADVFDLGYDANGFLKGIGRWSETGIYLAGTAKGPMNIADSMADARRVAMEIITDYRTAAIASGVM